MKIRPLGKTDLHVSNICLGTMQFGWTADEDASFAVMDAFVAAGGNFLDTADIYSNWYPGHKGGESEEVIGRWLKARGNRNSVVVATKLRGKMWDGADGEGLSRSHVLRAAEESLRRLQIETVDLYQCHWPDENVPTDETLRAFEELIASGKVRYIGASNYTISQLEDARRDGLPHFASLQPHYNLVHRREYEDSLESFCAREQLGVIPYSPLAQGFLTGKYRRDQPPPKSQRARSVRGYMNERSYNVIDALEKIATVRGVAIAAVALAWMLAKPTITAPITGANNVEQLNDLLPAGSIELTAEEVAALDYASR